MEQNDLLDRTFNFGVDVLKFIRQLPRDSEYNLIRFQLGKSATSTGANYEESQAGSSKADFKNKIRIALKEARESNYWLRIIKALSESESLELNRLLQESKEIKNILAAILNKMN
nr:four helix bundle protein [uncultured Flavobacterium sp.]